MGTEVYIKFGSVLFNSVLNWPNLVHHLVIHPSYEQVKKFQVIDFEETPKMPSTPIKSNTSDEQQLI